MEQMQYQFTKQVSTEGTILLDNLPVGREFTIVLTPKQEKQEFLQLLEQLQKGFRETSPLSHMSEDELVAHLRQVRDKVADELYPDTA